MEERTDNTIGDSPSLSQRAIYICVISSRGSDAADHHKLWTFLDEKGFSKSLSKDITVEVKAGDCDNGDDSDTIPAYHYRTEYSMLCTKVSHNGKIWQNQRYLNIG